MSFLVLVRHGQSEWNKQNRFTGWVDVDLAPEGEEEAAKAGKLLKPYHFDVAYTSALKRAQHTLQIILETSKQTEVPVIANQALNERMYGDLQGLDKDETRAKFGAEQVHIWRRSYDIPPPNGESLKDTADRVMPYFKKEILPKLQEGKNVIVAAHGNSLRALIMFLEELNESEIVQVEIPTGTPMVYEFDANMHLTTSRKQLRSNPNDQWKV